MIRIEEQPFSRDLVIKGLSNRMTQTGPLMTQLAADLQRIVRRNFEAGGRPVPWPVSRRAAETGGKILIDQGLLVNSIFRRNTGSAAVVFTTHPQAWIHHKGGTIRPKNAKRLTVPIHPAARGRRARDFSDTFILHRDGKPPLIMRAGVDGQSPTALFVLLTSVTIPARPFMVIPESERKRVLEPRINRWITQGVTP